MKKGLLTVAFTAALYLPGWTQVVAPPSFDKKPVYFHISHHQEDVGHPRKGFPNYFRWKENLKEELHLLDSFRVISDMCFSDYMVSVINYMKESGKDPNATDIYSWFNNSRQNLGYHFHPSTWDINIRLDKIKELGLEEGIREYEKWEKAYYDWSGYLMTTDTTRSYGLLDTSQLGGIALMLQYLKKPLVNENLTMINPAAGQVIRQKFGQIVPVVGQTGNPHSYYSKNVSKNLWISDWGFSTAPWAYAYKMMGNYFIQNRSEAWIEGLFEVSLLRQVLGSLRRNIPHLFAIHLSTPPKDDQSLRRILEFLTTEFIPANPGSCFISTSDIPSLSLPNPVEFTMNDLDEICLDVLFNWHGCPPAFGTLKENQYISPASLFKALQGALQDYLKTGPGIKTWPALIKVPSFIWPPEGTESSLMIDKRLIDGFSTSLFETSIRDLKNDDRIPFTISIPSDKPGETPYMANSADMLKGMCTFFLQLRNGTFPDKLHILPSGIIPLSDLSGRFVRNSDTIPDTPMDWLTSLQLWTLEPLHLRDTFGTSGIGKTAYFSPPPRHILQQNYPNPFSRETTIRFFIAEKGQVELSVFDITGKNLKTLMNENLDPGWYTTTWNGTDASGNRCTGKLFFYRMIAPGYVSGRKIIHMK